MKILSTAFILALGATSAHALTLTYDFESGLPSTFSGTGDVESVQGYEGVNGFTGNLLHNDGAAGEATEVMISGLGSHSMVSLSFDLAFIDSWDGGQPSNFGPDFFNVEIDGVEVFEASVGNSASVLPSASVSNREFGAFGFNPAHNDQAVTVSFAVAHTGSDLSISFFADGAGYQGGTDESWAIDNLVVDVDTTNGPSIVPLPAGLPLLLAGLGAFGALSLRRRT